MPAVADPKPASQPRKKLQRRLASDRSQALRRAFQAAFLALNVWIAVEFFLFVRFYESGGSTVWAQRPPGVEGWLPIASLMNLKVWLLTGEIPALHPAGMFLLIAFVSISFAFRKTFCSWLCPVGTISEWLWKLGRETFGRNFQLPRGVDIPLRGLKYAVFRAFPLCCVAHAGGGDPGVSRRSLRRGGGREDAEFLPLPGVWRSGGGGSAGAALGVRAGTSGAAISAPTARCSGWYPS